MRRALVIALLSIPSAGAAQAMTALKRSLANGDSSLLRAEVTRRPNDARDLLGDLVAEAGRPNVAGDSLLRMSFRLASAYANIWADSFPLKNLDRFTRMPPRQRREKAIADSLRLAGNAAYGARGPEAAIVLWRAALRRSRDVGDTAGMAAAVGNIGAGFYRLTHLDSARVYLERSRDLAEAVSDRRTEANAMGTLASVAKDRGELVRAADAYRRALELRTRIGDVVGASADQNNLGLVAAALGDTESARHRYDAALRIAREQGLDPAAATALLNRGNLAAAEADYREAVRDYDEALRLSRLLGNADDVALLLQNLARLDLQIGAYASARDRLVQSLAIFTRIGTRVDLIQVRRDLAAVDVAIGDLHGGLLQLRAAERLLRAEPASPRLAGEVALSDADVAVQLNEYGEAEREYSKAQSLYRQAADADGEAEARQGSASLLVKRQQYDRAQTQLEAVLRAQAAAGARRPASLTRLMLGSVHMQRGDATGARRLLMMSRDTLHVLGDVVGEAGALLMLGGLDLDAHAPLAAEADFREGVARLGARTAPNIAWQLHAGLARALRAVGATGRAIRELRVAIAEVERVAATVPGRQRRSVFLADKWQPYTDLALLQREAGAVTDAFVSSERMRARQMLATLSRGVISAPPGADSVTVLRERSLRRRIAELTQRLEGGGAADLVSGNAVGGLRGPDVGDAETGVTREALANAQEEYAGVLENLEDQADTVARREPGLSSWRAVASKLRQDQAMLEYLVTDSTTVLFVVRADTIQALDLGVGGAMLAPLIEFARAAVRRRDHDSAAMWRGPLGKLYAQLVAPAEQAGLLDGATELVIVPHAELHYLPFAALFRPGGRGEFLVERYDIGYAPSAAVWLRLRDQPVVTNGTVLALAPRSRVLPGSRDEVEAIGALYGSRATILRDRNATERRLRETAGAFEIVHLATYGVLNQHNPLFSFVELNADSSDDGRLEVHEVFGMKLRARLVVLSACQTGLGSGATSDVPPGDDWVGLAQAFLSAGAAHVIASLWAVEDRSTARLMGRLHRRLGAGMSVVAALSGAQRDMLRNSQSADPFYWAGLVDVGGATP